MIRVLLIGCVILFTIIIVLAVAYRRKRKAIPCPSCKGVFTRYCPRCQDWRMEGFTCLDCGRPTTRCPICKGTGLMHNEKPNFIVSGSGTIGPDPILLADSLKELAAHEKWVDEREEKRKSEADLKKWLASEDD